MAGDEASFNSLGDSQQSEESDPEERQKFEQREKDIEKDVNLMESLF